MSFNHTFQRGFKRLLFFVTMATPVIWRHCRVTWPQCFRIQARVGGWDAGTLHQMDGKYQPHSTHNVTERDPQWLLFVLGNTYLEDTPMYHGTVSNMTNGVIKSVRLQLMTGWLYMFPSCHAMTAEHPKKRAGGKTQKGRPSGGLKNSPVSEVPDTSKIFQRI